MLGLVLRLYQLTRPGFLTGVTEYDDGAYFGSALRLLSGSLPYRDFVMVQPPGITWLMAPLALLAKVTSSGSAFAVARVLTALAGAAGVALAGLLVRHRGPVVTGVVCGVLAAYPSGVNAAHTVLLEPWVVVFCLLGALSVFQGDLITGRRGRLIWGGVAFGFAAAIKLWAVLPAVVVLVLCRRRRAWLPYLGGLAAGFGATVLPLFVLAPHALLHDAVAAQLGRVDVSRLPVWDRLANLTGLSAFSPVSHGAILAAVFGLGALAGAGFLRDRRRPDALEWFALVTAVLVLVAFLWPPDYYLHYGWFFAPFLGLSLGLSVGRLAERVGVPSRPRSVRAAGRLLIVLAVAAAGVLTVVQLRQEARLRGDSSPRAARAVIPAGACVLTDLPSLTIAADRFTSRVAGCSTMVDPIGTDYALSGGQNGVTGAGRVPAVQARVADRLPARRLCLAQLWSTLGPAVQDQPARAVDAGPPVLLPPSLHARAYSWRGGALRSLPRPGRLVGAAT